MNKERESLLFLRNIFDEAQKIEETKRNHENEHPYAIVEGETVEDDGLKLGFLLVNSVPDLINSTEMIESMFSLYGDVIDVTLDQRFNTKNDPKMRYFIIQFADDESVEEVFRCKDRLVIGKNPPLKIYRMRKEPTERFSN